jgi:hypothetical protein
MAYRGEDIDFRIKGTDEVDLDANNFSLLIYPNGRYDEAYEIPKVDMTKVSNNLYVGSIPYEKSKTMVVGSYTVELLMIINGASRSIYAQRGALVIFDSASKEK